MGVLLVLSGTSGAGKDSIARALVARDPNLSFVVTATTRAPRPGEEHGVHYHFMTEEEFVATRDSDGFLEWFEVYADLKGTPREAVEQQLAQGDVILRVNVDGALRVQEKIPDALLVFVKPPTMAIQRARMEARGADTQEAIERRLAKAEVEEAQAEKFDAIVINDDLEQAIAEVAAILADHRAKQK